VFCGHQQVLPRQQGYVDAFVQRKQKAAAAGQVRRRAPPRAGLGWALRTRGGLVARIGRAAA
jgi:hypothetical protein